MSLVQIGVTTGYDLLDKVWLLKLDLLVPDVLNFLKGHPVLSETDVTERWLENFCGNGRLVSFEIAHTVLRQRPLTRQVANR